MDDKNKKPDEEEEKEKLREKIEELLSQTGQLENVKIIAIKIPKRTFFYCMCEAIFMFVINIILLMSAWGYFSQISSSFFNTLFIALAFSGFETIIRNIMFIFWKKNYIRYLFIINMISLFSSALLVYYAPFLNVCGGIMPFLVCIILTWVIREFVKRNTFDLWMDKILDKLDSKKKRS